MFERGVIFLVLLLGNCFDEFQGITIDVETCFQLQLKSALLEGISQNAEEGDIEFLGRFVHGVKEHAVQCVKMQTAEVSKDKGSCFAESLGISIFFGLCLQRKLHTAILMCGNEILEDSEHFKDCFLDEATEHAAQCAELLTGNCYDKHQGITLDVETCTQLQWKQTLWDCAVEYLVNSEFYKECFRNEGRENAMQCIKAELTEDVKDDGIGILLAIKEYQIKEFLVTQLTEAVADCMLEADIVEDSDNTDLVTGCILDLIIKRTMDFLKPMVLDVFQDSEYILCWIQRALDGFEECIHPLDHHVSITGFSSQQQQERSDVVFCLLKHGINATAEC
ncbi:uncharacterized protein [Lepisosteus oculatus]|nr:PREDICTED: uncharacterized protein LOC107076987 isoform X2 [Lepisosteus oculatus]XP_015199369.1 PREDICTED: uncharacterized protein LOC107076987 isoform X2 [Lepisosteus oculatus]XP_015199370.1 PREDICTED: uncharacterized protein LOC107076987 isoform X2 [Lepisosteus oculatus]